MDHSNYKIFIDTNIILDVLLKRRQFFDNSSKIFELCTTGRFHGYISEQSVTTIWYILRKEKSADVCRFLMSSLFDFLDICSVDKIQIRNALARTDFSDFEDCLQDESALEVHVEYIITRNKSDFASSKVTAYLPEEFIKIIA